MPTQRLVLLLLLVAVAGGCSIWYTKMILPAGDDVSEIAPVTAVATKDTEPKTAPAKVAVKPKAPTQAEPSVFDKVSDAIGATEIANALADIAESADAIYDDSALQAQVTSSEPASLTSAYGI